MNAPGWPEKGWHYRRSLASRVILLTTIAVGFAVALVALAVFLTVRMQMQSSLDQSLLDPGDELVGRNERRVIGFGSGQHLVRRRPLL